MVRSHHIRLVVIGLVLVAVAIGIVLFTRHDRAANGSLYVTLQIPADSMPHDATMKLGDVEVWSEQRGWRTVGSVREAIDLKNPPATARPFLILRAPLKAGAYERVRITVAAIERPDHVTEVIHVFEPSITLPAPLTIQPQEASALLLTLQLTHSLYPAENSADLVFVPTIAAQTRAGVTIESDPFSVTGGSTLSNQTYGMRADGSMRANYRLPFETTFAKHADRLVPSLVLSEPTPVELLMQQELEARNATTTSDDVVADPIEPSTDEEIAIEEELTAEDVETTDPEALGTEL